MKKQTNGFIYLIGELDNINHYKIGFTRNSDIGKRKNKLQTGSSNELYIRYTFFSNHVNVLEKMLHRHYAKYHKLNEWFEISDEEAQKFLDVCKHYQNIIDSLQDNPFF